MADSGDSDSDSDINTHKPHKKLNNIESDGESSSSSSVGEAKMCSICLTDIGRKDLSSPNSCSHSFCLNCLTQWAKNAKTCPIDRLKFTLIVVRNSRGHVLQEIDISNNEESNNDSLDSEDLTYCEVCHLCNREDEMLLCDICDNGYHMDCINPPLFRVPVEEWYCPQCHGRERGEISEEQMSYFGQEVFNVLTNLHTELFNLSMARQPRIREPRLVPRTRAAERVRMHTRRIQENVAAELGNQEQSTSSRKNIKRHSKRKIIVKKRSKKHNKIRKKNTNLVERLGLCSSRGNRNSTGNNGSLGTLSNFVDHTSLSILGSRHELDYVADWSDGEHEIGGDESLHMVSMPRIRVSTADLILRKEISEIARRPVHRNINISHNTNSINILDAIMNVQENRFKKKPTKNIENIDKHIIQTPMYSDRTDKNSDNFNNYSSNRNNNRSYPKNNDRPYSDAGNSSTYEESRLTNEQNFSENQPINPFPYRNSGPIKFRMNVTKMGERKQPQTPPKVVTTEYNVEGSGPSTQTEETFKALEPPPDPPALLLGINLDEDDADNLVIDDKDYYDPENPSDGDDEDTAEIRRPTTVTGYMQSPTYGGYMEQVENRSIPIIPVSNSNNILRPDNDGIVSSEEEEKEINDDCPNISLYSSTSLKLSTSPKEYGPILEHEATKSDKLNEDAELQYIPMPPVSPERISLSDHEESPKSEEVDNLESIEVNDDGDKCVNVNNSDRDENKSNSDDDVINEINLDVECENELSKAGKKEQQSDFEIEPVTELNDSTEINKENQSLISGAACSEVSCSTLICSDNDNQQKESDNLNFDPISDSEDEKKKVNRSSGSNQKREKLPNGKTEITDKQKGNKEKTKKPIVKNKDSEKGTVPWKKLSKPSKDRNYRYGKGKEKPNEEIDRKEKKQKRKEIELYDVRRVLEDRPRRKKDKFGRDLSKSSNSDSGSKDRSKRKKRKGSRSKQRKRSVSISKPKSRKRSKSRYRSESKNRHRSKSQHRSRSRYRSRSSKHLNRYDKGQVTSVKERYRSPSLFDDHEMSPLLSKRQAKKSKEKVSIYSKIEKDYERKLLKNDKSAKKKLKKKSKDYQFSSLSPRSLSPGLPVWKSPREHNMSPWSHTDISRTPSPVYSRHAADMEINYSNRDQEFPEYNDNNVGLNNLTVIVKNDNLKKSKFSKRHNARQIAIPPVKEVFASGDNILVSVNFNKDTAAEQIPQESLKRKRQETLSVLSTKKSKNTSVAAAAIPDTTSANHKTTNLKRAQNPRWQNRRKIVRTIEGINAKPVAIIDLNTSPFKEIEMSPKSIIVLTDSDEDKQVSKSETKKDNSPEKSKENIVDEQKSIEKNENSTQTIPTITIGGPKTPPEPINAISKPDNISNNSCEFNSQDEDHNQSHDVRGRGPNTPPEPPRSVDTITSETAYDPFEPTKSNSPSPPPRIDMFEDDDVDHDDHDNHNDDHDDDNNANVIDDNDDNDNDDNDHHNDTPAQPLEENKTTDSQSPISPHRNVTTIITPPFLESQSSSQTDKTPEKLTTNVVTNQSLYTSPIKVAKTPSPKQPTPTATNTDEIINLDDNDDSQTTAFDNEADSPYSPSEGFVDEIKGSSPVSPISQPKNIVSTTSQSLNKNEARSKLDTLLSILPRVKKPSNNVFDNIAKITNLKPLKLPSKSKQFKPTVVNDDNVDDLPGSAVELESKNKFLEKLNRQERVIEEVKHVLKPHYNKKHITKEQYKDIMRKAVPKICHNKSGEINPQKIHSLIEAYVIKYRHSHRKQVQRLSNK